MDPKPVALAAWRSGVCATWGAVRRRTEPSFASAREGRAPRSVPTVLGAAPFSAEPGREVGNSPEEAQGPAHCCSLVPCCLALWAWVFWEQMEADCANGYGKTALQLNKDGG